MLLFKKWVNKDFLKNLHVVLRDALTVFFDSKSPDTEEPFRIALRCPGSSV